MSDTKQPQNLYVMFFTPRAPLNPKDLSDLLPTTVKDVKDTDPDKIGKIPPDTHGFRFYQKKEDGIFACGPTYYLVTGSADIIPASAISGSKVEQTDPGLAEHIKHSIGRSYECGGAVNGPDGKYRTFSKQRAAILDPELRQLWVGHSAWYNPARAAPNIISTGLPPVPGGRPPSLDL